eukprot:TRINITY_DN14641_c0_g1_i1.p1 TRINITY_DN14641_c0_g1~~TRINITY_DN14641_c0_g1_i1.p1  ORF type:complete len:518 (-),score=96.12 TRINITY_DN14641_c0_g1_i1:3-1424(-)
MTSNALINFAEVQQHNTRDDCWVVIHGKVFDITSFLPHHPGGAAIILRYGGKDATPGFEMIHPEDMLQQLPPDLYLGDVDPSTLEREVEEEEDRTDKYTPPPMHTMLNIHDFEAVAQKMMSKEGWDYYCSGADDEITLRDNMDSFKRLWLRPRVLVNVKDVNSSCKILNFKSSFPLYITATAMGKLAHPEGEVVLTRAAHAKGIIQMIPTLASCSLKEMIDAREEGQVQFYQVYVNPDRKVTEDRIRQAERGGCKAICLTVDAPALGRRERDMRNKVTHIGPDQAKAQSNVKMNRNEGTARALSAFIDPSLSWDDVEWMRGITKLPLVLKGVQCAEDAVLAARRGIDAVVLSNHGGRQLDCARSAIDVLPEVTAALKEEGLTGKMEVWIDGGIRRGTDIFKALALGATAVGVGRPVLYGMAGYGQEGVERVLQLLQDEFEMVMRLTGVTAIDQIVPRMVHSRDPINHHLISRL